MLGVLGVLLFRDILINGLNRNICPLTGFKAHASGCTATVTDDGWDGGDRHDSCGQYAVTDQRIQDRGFAAFELTDTSNVEAPIGYPFGHRPRIDGNLLGGKLLG